MCIRDRYWHHRDMLAVGAVVEEVEARFAEVFGRAYPGMVDAYLCEDADFVLVTLGSAAGLARDVADELRAQGKRAGVLRIRYLRPMPDAALARALADAAAVGVLEQEISFGGTGTVYANVLASLALSLIHISRWSARPPAFAARRVPSSSPSQSLGDVKVVHVGIAFSYCRQRLH